MINQRITARIRKWQGRGRRSIISSAPVISREGIRKQTWKYERARLILLEHKSLNMGRWKAGDERESHSNPSSKTVRNPDPTSFRPPWKRSHKTSGPGHGLLAGHNERYHQRSPTMRPVSIQLTKYPMRTNAIGTVTKPNLRRRFSRHIQL